MISSYRPAHGLQIQVVRYGVHAACINHNAHGSQIVSVAEQDGDIFIWAVVTQIGNLGAFVSSASLAQGMVCGAITSHSSQPTDSCGIIIEV